MFSIGAKGPELMRIQGRGPTGPTTATIFRPGNRT